MYFQELVIVYKALCEFFLDLGPRGLSYFKSKTVPRRDWDENDVISDKCLKLLMKTEIFRYLKDSWELWPTLKLYTGICIVAPRASLLHRFLLGKNYPSCLVCLHAWPTKKSLLYPGLPSPLYMVKASVAEWCNNFRVCNVTQYDRFWTYCPLGLMMA